MSRARSLAALRQPDSLQWAGHRSRGKEPATNRESPRSAEATFQLERQRILAARGWEHDTDRRRVVRELLSERLRQAYLWSYAKHRNRDRALERTRTAALRAAHSLGQIPEECSFASWLFLELRRAGGPAGAQDSSSGCPEAWRVTSLAERPIGSKEYREHIEQCGACRHLLEDYRSFLADPEDALLVERSSWPRAVQELERFLEGYFNDASEKVVAGVPSLRDRMPLLRLSGSRLLAAGIGAVALALVLMLLVQNLHSRELSAQRKPGMKNTGKSITVVPPPRGPHLEHMDGTLAERRGDRLAFRWEPFEGADHYRVIFLSAKLDTLHRSGMLGDTQYEVPLDQIVGYAQDASYLYKVEALKGQAPRGTSGFVPFSEH